MTEDIKKLIKKLEDKQDKQFAQIISEIKKLKEAVDSMGDMDGDGAFDELYDEAKETVINEGKASTSYLQRKLGIGYSRACSLIDALEEDKIIGPNGGAKPREIFMKNSNRSTVYDNVEEDELYEKAKAIAVKAGKISTSYLQRKLGTGYARSARLMDMLEENNVIEKGEGAKPRRALVKD